MKYYLLTFNQFSFPLTTTIAYIIILIQDNLLKLMLFYFSCNSFICIKCYCIDLYLDTSTKLIYNKIFNQIYRIKLKD